MRYSLRAPLEGHLVLEFPNRRMQAVRGSIELALELGDKGTVQWAGASIQLPPEKVKAFRTSTSPGIGGSALTIHLGGDQETEALLLRALQDLELELAFAFPGNALSRIRWTELEHKLEPETEEEKALVPIYAYSKVTKYPDNVAKITEDGFRALVDYTGHTRNLLTAKAFWLLGKNDMADLQHARAFASFFFVIEWLYANGQFHQDAVLDEFLKSVTLTSTFTTVLATLRKDHRHWDNVLTGMTWEHAPEPQPRDLGLYLLKCRGTILHASRRNAQKMSWRHGGQDVETAALTAMQVAGVSIEKEEIAIKPRGPLVTPWR